MKTEKERRKVGLFKVVVNDVYITDDNKKFYNEEDAKDWQWYLDNKTRIKKEYKFEDVSPITLNLRYMIDPVFCYKFYIENYTKDKENDIVNFLCNHIIEKGIDFKNGDLNIDVRSHIKDKIDGWHVVVLEKILGDWQIRKNRLRFFFLPDLVTNITNE